MKPFLAALLLVFSSLSFGDYVIYSSDGVVDGRSVDLSCASVSSALLTNSHWQGLSIRSCSDDPVRVGTTLFFAVPDGAVAVISAISPICASGTHFDTSTNTCVDDIGTAIVSCLPSIRTIAPCPSGFAPTNAIPSGAGAPDPYISGFDTMPIQDMLYAIGVCLFGVLGVGVGVRLT